MKARQARGPTGAFQPGLPSRGGNDASRCRNDARVTLSVKMNMFGYDDDELNKVLMGLVQNAAVMVQVTLDRSQAAGPTEKAILASDAARLDYEYAVAAAQKRPVLAAAAAPAKAGLATPRLD